MRLTFESVDWVRQTALPSVGGPYSISSGGLDRTKPGLGKIYSLTAWDGMQAFSWPQIRVYTIGFPGSQAFRFRLEFAPQAPKDLQLADGIFGTFQFPQSYETISHKKSLSLYISYWSCPSGEAWLRHSPFHMFGDHYLGFSLEFRCDWGQGEQGNELG